MSTIAVFGVLAGGVAVAANTAPKNSVATKSIKDAAVTAPKLGCKGNSPDDVMVKVGSVCIDRYENSIWDARKGGNQIAGVPIPCNDNGQDCDNIFARSVAGTTPAPSITWFQAQQALANSGKRLPTNAEWQMAVAGTPDSSACNVSNAGFQNTGSSPGCISRFGANDMVGNLSEWVADWDEQSAISTSWPGADFGSDYSSFGRGSDAASTGIPGAPTRGGNFCCGGAAGPFAVDASVQPSSDSGGIGFRGAR
jgi:formylglycine-generating enzyme required for sulfatase activity